MAAVGSPTTKTTSLGNGVKHSNTISKIFWPSNLCSGSISGDEKRSASMGGYLVGWNSQSFTACIATVVPVNHFKSLKDLEDTLSKLPFHPSNTSENTDTTGTPFSSNSSSLASETLSQLVASLNNGTTPPPTSPPIVLGIVVHDESDPLMTLDCVIQKRQSANLWMTMALVAPQPSQRSKQRRSPYYEPSQTQFTILPTLKSIHCCGYAYHTNLSAEIIIYHIPNTKNLQYLTLDPYAFSDPYLQNNNRGDTNTNSSTAGGDWTYQGDTSKEKLLMKFDSHAKRLRELGASVSGHWGHNHDDLGLILRQINSAHDTRRSLFRQHTRFHLDFTPIFNALYKCLALFFLPISGLISIVLFILNINIPTRNLFPTHTPSVTHISLKHISAIAQQLDLRLRQLHNLPIQAACLRHLFSSSSPPEVRSKQYIQFYNTIWLIANDIIIGVTLGHLLSLHSNEVAMAISKFLDTYTVSIIRDTIKWLMGWPAGLKLNSALDSFLGELFLWLIHSWTVFVTPLQYLWKPLVLGIAVSGVLGASIIFSALNDVISLATLHIYLFYLVAGKIYYWQVNVIWSLFHLFQGKKHNVLRKRLDSCQYALDQLLLGTIFFTLLVFLYPTVAAFYLLFAIFRIVVIMLHAILEIVLALLNHFPLFALMLRLKDSKRLPGGLRFSILSPFGNSQRHDSASDEETHGRDGRDPTSPYNPISASPNTASLGITTSGLSPTNSFATPSLLSPSISTGVSTIPTAYMHMKSVPISMQTIFYQYSYLLNGFVHNYLNVNIVRSLIFGEHLKPVQRLQYDTFGESDAASVRVNLSNALAGFWMTVKLAQIDTLAETWLARLKTMKDRWSGTTPKTDEGRAEHSGQVSK